jgi:hypothetical protein
MKKFRIYDNGGKTFDRYTFVVREKDTNTLHFWGASENPFHPQGFGQYCGSSDDIRPCHVSTALGRKVKVLADLPDAVIRYFNQCARLCDWDSNNIKLS